VVGEIEITINVIKIYLFQCQKIKYKAEVGIIPVLA
jgi:hypothetical protein